MKRRTQAPPQMFLFLASGLISLIRSIRLIRGAEGQFFVFP